MPLLLIPSEYIVSGGIGLLLFGFYLWRELARTNERMAKLEGKLEQLTERLERKD